MQKSFILNYRKDIDGLRAIAVLAVVFYHLDFSYFSGGYLGVDIFFVISGFLITGLIRKQTNKQTFSIAQFYLRRIRRILPALLSVVFAVSIAAIMFLPKSEIVEYFQSVVSVSTFTANFFFWQHSDYFSTAAEFKPMLHTWSLGIEEQFYIFFPLFMWMVRDKTTQTVKVILLVTALISFTLCVIPFASQHQTAVFYLPFTRFWELLLGSSLALTISQPSKSKKSSDLIAIFAFMLVIGGVFLFNDNNGFNAWQVMIVVFGTVLMIYAGQFSPKIYVIILENALMRQIGLISYSMYLWHWPILALWKSHYSGEILMFDKAIIFSSIVLLSLFSYYFIEQPFRKNSKYKHLLGLKTGIIALVVTSIIAFSIAYAFDKPNHESVEINLNSSEKCFNQAENLQSTIRCSFGDKTSENKFLVYGDSKANAMYPAFQKLATEYHWRGIIAAFDGCPPLFDVFINDNLGYSQNCKGVQQKNIKEFLQTNRINRVFLVARWSLYQKGWYKKGRLQKASHFISDSEINSHNAFESSQVLKKGIARTLQILTEDFGIPITVLLYAPILPKDISQMNNLKVSRAEYSNERKYIYDIFKSFEKNPLITLLDPIDIFCQIDCINTLDGKALYRDDHHMNNNGAFLFYPKLVEIITDKP